MEPVESGRIAPEDWNAEDVRRKIKISDGVVVICPERNTEVPVIVRLFAADPGYMCDQWDHIAEAPLTITSGELEIHECTGKDLARFNIAAGDYMDVETIRWVCDLWR